MEALAWLRRRTAVSAGEGVSRADLKEVTNLRARHRQRRSGTGLLAALPWGNVQVPQLQHGKDSDARHHAATGREFDLARALIEARAAAGLSQSQLAKKMKTSQSYIAHIERGKVRPSTEASERFAQATRTRLRIIFEPEAAR